MHCAFLTLDRSWVPFFRPGLALASASAEPRHRWYRSGFAGGILQTFSRHFSSRFPFDLPKTAFRFRANWLLWSHKRVVFLGVNGGRWMHDFCQHEPLRLSRDGGPAIFRDACGCLVIPDGLIIPDGLTSHFWVAASVHRSFIGVMSTKKRLTLETLGMKQLRIGMQKKEYYEFKGGMALLFGAFWGYVWYVFFCSRLKRANLRWPHHSLRCGRSLFGAPHRCRCRIAHSWARLKSGD